MRTTFISRNKLTSNVLQWQECMHQRLSTTKGYSGWRPSHPSPSASLERVLKLKRCVLCAGKNSSSLFTINLFQSRHGHQTRKEVRVRQFILETVVFNDILIVIQQLMLINCIRLDSETIAEVLLERSEPKPIHESISIPTGNSLHETLLQK